MMRNRNSLRTREKGLSLVELLVALTLGLIIVAALSQLFVNISSNNQEMARTNSQIENARFAVQFLREDLIHAGFWGEFVPQFDDISLGLGITPEDPPTTVPDPCRDFASWDQDHVDNLLGIPVAVYDAVPGTCGGVIQNRVAGTDILVVRHANTCEPGVGSCSDTGGAGQLYFRTSLCEDDPIFNAGPVVDKPYKLDNAIDPNEPQNLACDSEAPRRLFRQTIFYVRDHADEDDDGNALDSIPTLMRSQYEYDPDTDTLQQQDPVPLVEGIEGLRVELGIDNRSEPYAGFPDGNIADPNEPIEWLDEDVWDTPTNRGDGAADGDFVHCGAGCSFTQLSNVVTARVYLLARASEETPGYNDGKSYTLGSAAAVGPFNDAFKRHVFSTTARLVNVSSRRETP